MQSAIDQFRISIKRVRDLIALHNSINVQSTPVLDLSDILRAALVLTISALDYYIHEVVTLGMLEIYRGQRAEPAVSANTSKSAFSRFKVSLGGARQDRQIALNISSCLETEIQSNYGSELLENSNTISDLLPIISNSIINRLNNTAWLENEIREILGYQSFQQLDKIADAIRLISDKKLWDEVANNMNTSAKDIKQQHGIIYQRTV
ncbi:MAG: hypothetical protein QNJ64_20375 [Crocosphaera sp.]|nr:hypothetical protein [Crocosphaera sp.]